MYAKNRLSRLSFKPTNLRETTSGFSLFIPRKFLGRMCIKYSRHFSIVDDERFKDFVWEIDPMFRFRFRLIVATHFYQYTNKRKRFTNSFRKKQIVSLTTDTCTLHVASGYLVVHCEFSK